MNELSIHNVKGVKMERGVHRFEDGEGIPFYTRDIVIISSGGEIRISLFADNEEVLTTNQYTKEIF